MKGLSVVFTLFLLVLATQLAVRLKRADALPAQRESRGAVDWPGQAGSLLNTAGAHPKPHSVYHL